MAFEAMTEKEGNVFLRVRVQPKASRDALLCEPDGRIRVALTAPATEGAANKALKAFLAKTFGVPKRAVGIISGEKSRVKRLVIAGITLEQARKAIQNPRERLNSFDIKE